MPKASRVRHVAHHSSVKLKRGVTLGVNNAPSLADPAKLDEMPDAQVDSRSEAAREPLIQQKKKDKQLEKREAFLQKMEPSPRSSSKSHERRMKRKAKEQLKGGMDDLHSALATLEKEVQGDDAPVSTIAEAQDEAKFKGTVKAGIIGKSGSSTLSNAQRKRAFELERLRHPLILTNPDFSSNPFRTIRTHAQNTLLNHETPT